MQARFFQLDAFTSRQFAGNPAAVMLLESYPDEGTLQALAAENNLAETAFIVPDGADFRIRWFTPTVEVPLCGHATLASAAVVLERLQPDRDAIVFHSASGSGYLPWRRSGMDSTSSSGSPPPTTCAACRPTSPPSRACPAQA
jgi:PhzF family phenazine biosynthesis protein